VFGRFKFVYQEISQVSTLIHTVFHGGPIMYSPVHSADGGFFCRLIKGSKTSDRKPERYFGIIVISEIITKYTGQGYGRCPRNYRMSTGIFRKRRCLK